MAEDTNTAANQDATGEQQAQDNSNSTEQQTPDQNAVNWEKKYQDLYEANGRIIEKNNQLEAENKKVKLDAHFQIEASRLGINPEEAIHDFDFDASGRVVGNVYRKISEPVQENNQQQIPPIKSNTNQTPQKRDPNKAF